MQEDTAAHQSLPRFTCRACAGESDAYQISVFQNIEFLSCQICGSVTITPIPDIEDIYQSIHSSRHAQLPVFSGNRERKHYQAHLADLKRAARGERFIDVTAHNGTATELARTTFFPNATGIDGNRYAIEIAQKRFQKSRFIPQTLHNFAQSGEKFDAAACYHGLEMTNDPDAYLEDLKMVLENGAAAYFNLCDGNHFMTPYNFMKWKEVRYPDRVYYFSRDGLDRLLARHGFKILKRYKRYLPYQQVIARYRQMEERDNA